MQLGQSQKVLTSVSEISLGALRILYHTEGQGLLPKTPYVCYGQREYVD